MKSSRYVLARMTLEFCTDTPEDFDEQRAKALIGESLILNAENSLIDLEVYLLAGKPGIHEDVVAEKYEYRDRTINIMQHANTVGSPTPVYYSMVWPPKNSSGLLVDGDFHVIDDAKKAAEQKADKLIERLKKRELTISKRNNEDDSLIK